MPQILPRLQRTGLRKGFSQGNSTWLAIGVGAWGLRKLHSMSQRQTEILIREELKPGERMIIANGTATIEQVQGQQLPVAKPKRKTKKRSEGALETDPA